MTTKDGLFEEEDFDRIDAVRKDLIQKQKMIMDSNAHIVQWGLVVAAMLSDGSLNRDEWRINCTKHLNGKALACALTKLQPPK